ncbi:MAG: ATP-grasp domain-containing protein, partial [Proteobacteria bacterium]|nr:ATP-grasp domain-containing protein [Pseudomonadota bacterium]
MQLRVLGSLEVRRGDDLVDIGSSNERKVLAALLVDANAVVSTSRLIEVIWGDDPPASDRNALQTYVARLRRRLRTAATPAPIVTRPPGYAIELRPDQLDSLQFRDLLDQARATLHVDASRALELLDDALGLWRGPAFAEFADDEVARAEAACLEELRQTAVENRVEALLALGRSADAVSVLEAVVASRPLSERPHAQLMRALARCGRQVDPLRLYQRFRERLADELGVVGVLAVELFETAHGLMVNELAMRPHNSAHWTIEGARTSQFEQHLRAVLDYPLGATTLTAPWTVMANLLGGDDGVADLDR